ncbi:hypothetical protein PPYR_05515 [Photinus pyralis]|uniref:glutathione-specific gamma-glutamylcyclotransferase n=1 Tax=Photinus pyralis TaxID=7054 RepID=A0A1Y1M281_PHOPY|nr:putative glutathione-specific gamma-glutamylcyclotransferase 2 [Photinus pyralis]KAB0801161.1 hypothetical protein PPYR_05515 [Photinus pyralis]
MNMWVFGYGSLIWKVDFPYEIKTAGYIKGYLRKFYQHSTDHRGTPENPGRVVTLIPDSEDSCVWGVAYKIPDKCVDQVIKHLNIREKGGYTCKKLTFFPLSGNSPFDILVYVGLEDNQNFAGAADDDSIALQIVNAVGPSGTNVDYLLNLAKSIREIVPMVDDEHLFSLEEKVLKLLQTQRKMK